MIEDPVVDVMSDRIEEEVRDRLLARPEWNIVKVVYRGEPGIVPVRLYPFGVVFISGESDAEGADGYTNQTGPVRAIRYDGFITVEVLVPDTTSLAPDEHRKADVASYIVSKRLVQAAKQALQRWGDAVGIIDGAEAVVSSDGRERTSAVMVDGVENALTVRPNETVANTATLRWHLYSIRQET